MATPAPNYRSGPERRCPEEPDVRPQVRFCESRGSASSPGYSTGAGVWLAEPRFPTHVYGYGSTALPFFILQRTCRLAIENFRVHDRLLWPPRPPAGSTMFLPPRPVRRPSSLAAAKRRPSCILGIGSGSGTTVASCEAIRGPGHGNLGLALPARPQSPPESHLGCCLVFAGAEGPKRLLTQT